MKRPIHSPDVGSYLQGLQASVPNFGLVDIEFRPVEQMQQGVEGVWSRIKPVISRYEQGSLTLSIRGKEFMNRWKFDEKVMVKEEKLGR